LESTWFGCSGLINGPIFSAPNCANYIRTLMGCSNMTNIIMTEVSAIDLIYTKTFQDCVNLASITSIDTTNAIDATDMFLNCPLLTAPDAPTQLLLTTIPPGYDYN
jgi:hypothetical protein